MARCECFIAQEWTVGHIDHCSRRLCKIRSDCATWTPGKISLQPTGSVRGALNWHASFAILVQTVLLSNSSRCERTPNRRCLIQFASWPGLSSLCHMGTKRMHWLRRFAQGHQLAGAQSLGALGASLSMCVCVCAFSPWLKEEPKGTPPSFGSPRFGHTHVASKLNQQYMTGAAVD